MQVCKSKKAIARLFSVILMLATGGVLFAQNQTTQIEMPQMLEMSTILTLNYTTKMHDRFLIIDQKTLYHIGASLKDLGKKCFAFEELDSSLIAHLLKNV